MIRLLRIELRKHFSYPTFWVILGLYSILFALVINGFQSFEIMGPEGEPVENSSMGYYAFPKVWHTVPYIASFFGLLIAIYMITATTNEHSFKTLRQSVINGLGIGEYIASKALFMFLLSVFATGIVFIVCLGFGYANSDPEQLTEIWTKVDFIFASFVQLFGFLCLAFLIGTWIKNSGLAIGLFLVYSLIIERLLAAFTPDAIDAWFPVCLLSDLIKFPFPEQEGVSPDQIEQMAEGLGMHIQNGAEWGNVGIAVIYAFAFLGGSYLLLTKRDI